MNHIEKFLYTIWKKGEVRELRIIDNYGKISFGYFDNIKDASSVALSYNQKASIYITLNPVNPALLARCNNKSRQANKKDANTSDKDIVSLDYLLVDCDPKRPSGISSTNEEKKEAFNLAQTLRADLGEPVIMGDSGNGYHLIYRHNAKSAEQLKEYLFSLAKMYDTQHVAIDTKVFNPSRISKVLGTWAIKGENIVTRPHRESRLLEVGQNPTILDIPALPEKALVPVYAHSNGTFDVRSFLSENHILVKTEKEWNNNTMLVLEECVFDSSHKNDASIIIHGDGKLSYQCFHNGCSGKTWNDLRNHIGRPKEQKTCNRCNIPIKWSSENGKSVPLNMDDSKHFCNARKLQQIALCSEPSPVISQQIVQIENDINLENTTEEMAFPINVFPPIFQQYFQNIAQSTQCPIDLPACSILPVVGTLLGPSTIEINKNWKEHPNIYLAVVGATGMGKSLAINSTTGTIKAIEDKLAVQYAQLKKEYEISLDVWQSTPKKMRNTTKPQKPNYKTVFTTNATTESIARILASQTEPGQPDNPGILLAKDEITGWIKGMNQYRSGKGDDAEFYLSCFSGSPAKYDRVNTEPLYIKQPALSIIGGIVPENIHILVPEEDDGFVERIIFTFPKPIRKHYTNIEEDIPLKAQIEQILFAMYGDRRREYVLSPEAENVFALYYENIQERITQLKSGHFKGFLEKSISYVGRFALILNALWQRSNTVESDIVNAAILLAYYFISHVQKAHRQLTGSKEKKETDAILEWAKRKKAKVVRVRTLIIAGIPGCNNVENTKKKLQDIVDMDFARWTRFGVEIEFKEL